MQDHGEDIVTRLCRLADRAQAAGRQAEAEQLVRLLYEAHDSPSFVFRKPVGTRPLSFEHS